jgi:hypothetical protein
MAPYFADLRGVVSWSEQFYAGHAALADLRDPWNRPMNLPDWWIHVHALGATSANVMAVGFGMYATFLIAAFYVVGRLDVRGGFLTGLFLISYAVMFAMERANVDLVIFCLLAMAVAFRRSIPAAALVLALAAILKLYPLFALGALINRSWQKALPWMVAGVLFFAVGVGDHLHALGATAAMSPNMRSGILSFGLTSLSLEFWEQFHRPDLYLPVAVGSFTVFLAATGVALWSRPLLAAAGDERTLFAFRAGAGVYIGAFFLGTNHDYRLIFLLFCLPLLFQLVGQNDSARRWAVATLALILISVNWLYLAADGVWPQLLLKHGVTWALLVCLIALFVASLPPELQWPRRSPRDAPDQREVSDRASEPVG